LCCGKILNALFDNIYHIFCYTKIAFKSFEELEYNYGTNEKGLKKYSIEKWLNFQVVDGKSVSDQIHVFENIIYDMKIKGIKLNQLILISSFIKNYHHFLFDYAKGLKKKLENFSFDDLLVDLRIEEKYYASHQQKSIFHVKAHVVEGSFKPRPKTFKKKIFNNNNNNNFNKPKSNYMNKKRV
jgi:hypothetical protein